MLKTRMVERVGDVDKVKCCMCGKWVPKDESVFHSSSTGAWLCKPCLDTIVEANSDYVYEDYIHTDDEDRMRERLLPPWYQ